MNRLNESLLLELKWWLKKCYPPFVYSPAGYAGDPGGFPVFIFHSVEPARFEQQMKFLSVNNYATPSLAELYEFISGKISLPVGSVFLTFDDGDRTLYDVAYPLLLKYGFRAVCFVCPGLIKEAGEESPFVLWDEVLEMEKSGAVDFQSHTLYHERIFTGEEILDFLKPSSFNEKLGLSVPRALREAAPSTPLGSPIYESGPRMGERPKYYDDERLRERCVGYVVERGGADFFKRRGWRRELRDFASNARKEFRGGSFEEDAVRRNEIFKSLSDSRCLLGEKLDKEVLHLAYPWGAGSGDAVQLSGRAGYLTNFWGPLESARMASPGINPYFIPRLKDDYLFRLPGKGRKPLAEIFGHKLARRAAKDDIY